MSYYDVIVTCVHTTSFNQIIASRSFAHLRAVFAEYSKISKSDIEKAIKKEFSGDTEDGLLAIGMYVGDLQLYTCTWPFL